MWTRSGIKLELLIDYWHGNDFVSHVWARSAHNGTNFKMACMDLGPLLVNHMSGHQSILFSVSGPTVHCVGQNWPWQILLCVQCVILEIFWLVLLVCKSLKCEIYVLWLKTGKKKHCFKCLPYCMRCICNKFIYLKTLKEQNMPPGQVVNRHRLVWDFVDSPKPN